MIRTILLLLMAAMMVAMIGCSNEEDKIINVNDPAPQPPQGVYTITGDDSVFIYWSGPYESDIVEFIIWRSAEEVDNYTEIGRRTADANPNLHLILYHPGFVDVQVDNGETYFYAISSVDKRGQVSDLSAETVDDTPRPDGMMTLYDVAIEQSRSAFDFSEHRVIDAGESAADVYVDRVDSVFYVNAANDYVDLQSMGYQNNFDSIGWAPQQGFSGLGWEEVVIGHTYVVRISDATDRVNYAKIRAISRSNGEGTVDFQWAYQTDDDNPELIPGSGDEPLIAGCNR